MGEHEEKAVVILDDLEVVAILLLPGRLQGQTERPVDPAAPEGVDNHLLRARGVQRVLEMLHEDVAAVGKIALRLLPLPPEKGDQPFSGHRVEEVIAHEGNA